MKLRRVTQIDLEIAETFTIRWPVGSPDIRCQHCGAPAVILDAAAAELFLDRFSAEAELNGLHVERRTNGLVVCLDRLRNTAPHLRGNLNSTNE